MEIFEVNGARYKVREKAIAAKQTDSSPRVAQLRREFAEHPSSGLTPSKLAGILRNAEQGSLQLQAELAEDIEEKDGHIQAELFKRKMAISNVDYEIRPPENASAQEQKDAADIEQMLKDVDNWHDILFAMSDGILKGYSNIEYCWGNYQNWRIPQQFEHRPASWFQLDQDDQNIILLRDQSGKGEALRPLNWLQHRHAAKSGYPARIGLVRQLAWPFIFKNYSVRDLAEFLEIYGIPIRIGKYPSGATDTEKRDLLRAVAQIGHNAGGIIPKGMEIEFESAASGSGSDPFASMIQWSERTQSKILVGQTLTAQVDSTGSQALGNVHNDVRMDIRDHDVRQIANTLNRDLILPMYMLNGKSYAGDPRRKPRLVFDTQEPEDLALYAESIPKLVDVGMQIPVRYAHEKLRIPEPENNEPILASASKAPTPIEPQPADKADTPPAKAALNAAIAALKASKQADKDGIEQLTHQLGQRAETVFNGLLSPVEQAIEEAESLEQLQTTLAHLAEQLDTQAYQDLLTDALMAAELAGRFDVSEGD